MAAPGSSFGRRRHPRRRHPSAHQDRPDHSGNLTRDPELRTTGSGTPVCSLRLASNTRRRDAAGEWVEKPNYFDVTIWGAQGENAARYLERGRGVALDGRLEWREWADRDGTKRQAVEVVADAVQFLGGGGGRDGGPAGERSSASGGDRFAEDDIPF